jgi:FkbM family methyltransferase
MFEFFSTRTNPWAKIRIDRFLERFGLRLRKSAFFPLSTSAVLHRTALRRLGAGDDGAGAVFLDVGAHLGETALALASAFPKARIHAFEPVTAIYRQLAQNCCRFPGITCHQLALGNETAQRRIALLSQDIACTENQVSRVPDAQTPDALCDTIQIHRLDDFCQAQGIEKIALLKTDTEGFELEVFKGALATLRKGFVQSILVEVTFWKNNPQHVLFDDVCVLLQPLGYELGGFYDHGYKRDTGLMWYTNAFFTLK